MKTLETDAARNFQKTALLDAHHKGGIEQGCFAMQKYSKIKLRNVPFPRPCGATGNDAQKLHAPAFAYFRGAMRTHEVLCLEENILLQIEL